MTNWNLLIGARNHLHTENRRLFYRNGLTNAILWIDFVTNVVSSLLNYRLMEQQWLSFAVLYVVFLAQGGLILLESFLFHQQTTVDHVIPIITLSYAVTVIAGFSPFEFQVRIFYRILRRLRLQCLCNYYCASCIEFNTDNHVYSIH